MVDKYLYGKVKRRTEMVKILSNADNIFNVDKVPEEGEGIEYNPNILIEPEQFYRISDFSETEYSFDFLTEDVQPVNYDQATRDQMTRLSYVCAIQEGIYFFQVISSRYYINKKWISIGELALELDKPIITLNEYADVIYHKDRDILYFKKLPIANKIFKGMDQLYREATAAETQEFLDSDFLNVSDDYNVGRVSIPNRKKIALVKTLLDNYNDVEKQAIYDYTREYGQVVYEDGKFNIETDDDLKYILWGIEERYHTTPISNIRRVANSVISL